MKKLYRSNQHRVLGGVAAGLADYLNTDVSIIRIAFLLLGLIDGIGVLLYLAMWLIVPEAPAVRES